MWKWLDRKIDAYQDHATETFEQLQQAHTQDPAAFQAQVLNVAQGAQGHYDPAAASAIGSPETAQFLGEPQPEQLRQMQQLQAHGQRMKALWDAGDDVELEIQAVEPTGASLGGQREFSIRVRVQGHPTATEAVCVQTIPDQMLGTYVVGARFEGKIDPSDSTSVGIFRPRG